MQNASTSYNKSGLYFLIGTTALSLLFIAYLSFTDSDFEENSQKLRVTETSTDLSEEEQAKPWISSDNLVQKGVKVYKAQCALCHGPKGLGDGNPGLIPPPRDLVEGKWKLGKGSKEHLFRILIDGVPDTSMVSFKHLPKIDRWALVHYISSITKNKVEDDPKKLEDFAKTAL